MKRILALTIVTAMLFLTGGLNAFAQQNLLPLQRYYNTDKPCEMTMGYVKQYKPQ